MTYKISKDEIILRINHFTCESLDQRNSLWQRINYSICVLLWKIMLEDSVGVDDEVRIINYLISDYKIDANEKHYLKFFSDILSYGFSMKRDFIIYLSDVIHLCKEQKGDYYFALCLLEYCNNNLKPITIERALVTNKTGVNFFVVNLISSIINKDKDSFIYYLMKYNSSISRRHAEVPEYPEIAVSLYGVSLVKDAVKVGFLEVDDLPESPHIPIWFVQKLIAQS